MLVVLAIISLGLLGTIIYFAFSPKSSRILKLASLGALGLIGLSLGICAVILIMGHGEDDGKIPIPVFADPPPTVQPKNSNIVETVVFFTIFFVIMLLIVFLVIRERKQKEAFVAKKPEAKAVFANTNDLDDLEIKPKAKENKKDEDDFDLGLDF